MEKFTRNEPFLSYFTYDQHNQVKTIVNHSIWWTSFIIYELSIYFYTAGTIGNILKIFLYYSINIILFYWHLHLLNDNLKGRKKKYFRLILSIITELAVFILIKTVIDYYTTNFNKISVSLLYGIKAMAALDFYRTIFFVGLSSLYWTASNISNFERKAKESEIKKLIAERDTLKLQTRLAQSENALLRQQINPHLLFNTLNFIHSTVYQVSEKAAETVIMLADIMRFSMEEAGEDGKILLKNEIEQIYNLITVNSSRFKTTAPINFHISGDYENLRIIPLVLITLVENIFKHGNFIDHEADIRLELSAVGSLCFYTRNYTKAKAPYPRLKSTGLQNIRIRLDYAYGDHYKLTSKEQNQEQIFESELIIQL